MTRLLAGTAPTLGHSGLIGPPSSWIGRFVVAFALAVILAIVVRSDGASAAGPSPVAIARALVEVSGVQAQGLEGDETTDECPLVACLATVSYQADLDAIYTAVPILQDAELQEQNWGPSTVVY